MQVAGEVETGSRHFFLLEVITGAVAYLPFRGQGKLPLIRTICEMVLLLKGFLAPGAVLRE